jgi:Domain of unknown function (DUF1833)
VGDDAVTSQALIAAVFKQETDEAFIPLLTIAHPDLEEGPIHVCLNSVDIISRGDTYIAYPFEIDLPNQDPEQPSRVTLTIDNVDRNIVAALRELEGAPTVTLEVVLASDPDIVEAGPHGFTLRNANYDILQIDGELAFEDILNEPFPAESFTPATHPGLF